MTKRLLLTGVFVLLGLVQAQEIRVAVAANLRDTFEQLVQVYNRSNPGIKVTPAYGASGAFTQQIASGAPFDIFMSADLAFPQDLMRRGLVEEGTLRTYAVGKLILFLPSRVGVQATSLRILTDPRITRLIIANPETAPYGRAAVQAMTRAGVYEGVRPKIAFGQNIAQAAQLTLAAGDAGFINLSAIYGPDLRQQGTWYIVPQNLYDPIEQGMVIVKGRARPEVRAFFAFLTSAEANRVYRAWGYDLPRAP
ncbi:MAG: molybdate ABC transporter substrate-binding protein [Meiothermus sp.]|nr:molybdate ABC transporter substrate-binding protein [Meiothermus sp.]